MNIGRQIIFQILNGACRIAHFGWIEKQIPAEPVFYGVGGIAFTKNAGFMKTGAPEQKNQEYQDYDN